MIKLFPSSVELAILAAIAVVCATVACGALGRENLLPVVLFPLLLTGLLMGARRNAKLAPARVRPKQPVEAGRAEQE